MGSIAILLFALSIVLFLAECRHKKITIRLQSLDIFLGYFLFLYVGFTSLISGFSHLIWPDQVAQMIGWEPSPFQFEVGMANLAFGVLGVLAYWIRGRFWEATLFSWSIFLLGDFLGHVIQYFSACDEAIYNFGFYIWFNDLLMPIFALGVLALFRFRKNLGHIKYLK